MKSTSDPVGCRILAVIPARGGSKSIPRKNVKNFLNKPLLAWTVEAARESGVCERVILSTDDEEIARVGAAYGAEVPFLRPKDLAQDTTPTEPVVRHTLDWLKDYGEEIPDFVMVLEPTSPSRRAFHIREAVMLLTSNGAESIASVSEVPHHYVPSKALKLHNGGALTGVDGTPIRNMIHRRQDLPKCYAFNGLIFACKTELILRNPPTLWGDVVLAHVSDPKYSLDLDRPEDWVPAEERMRQILNEEGK